ncbi:MAG: DsbC family protein [Rhodocyclaceae bacterium]|nr:DsbC family protein [Rhodocyclaceae bacterium]
MKIMKPFSGFALLTIFIANTALASEASISAAMQKRFPYQKLVSVTKTPYFGLYEVVFDDQLIYTDEKLNYLISGSVIDMRTMQNLTEAREKALFAVNLNTLPLDLALKRVKGNGSRKVVVFADPNCSFCKRLEKEMVNLDNLTTYIFPLSLLNGSEEKNRAIWCSPDRLKAWDDTMLRGVTPTAEKKCDTAALTKIAALAKDRRVSVTPTLIFEDGLMKPGIMTTDLIEQQLVASGAK